MSNFSDPQFKSREEEFAALVAAHDPRAFSLLWEYKPRLVLSIRRKFGGYISLEDCDDIATTALVEAYEDGIRFEPRKSTLATWLNVRAHYGALDFLRRHNQEIPWLDGFSELPARDLKLEELFEGDKPSQKIQELLENMPLVWNKAIQMFYYKGASVPLIATELEVSEGTVRSYLSRGVKRLRELLEYEEQRKA